MRHIVSSLTSSSVHKESASLFGAASLPLVLRVHDKIAVVLRAAWLFSAHSELRWSVIRAGCLGLGAHQPKFFQIAHRVQCFCIGWLWALTTENIRRVAAKVEPLVLPRVFFIGFHEFGGRCRLFEANRVFRVQQLRHLRWYCRGSSSYRTGKWPSGLEVCRTGFRCGGPSGASEKWALRAEAPPGGVDSGLLLEAPK